MARYATSVAIPAEAGEGTSAAVAPQETNAAGYQSQLAAVEYTRSLLSPCLAAAHAAASTPSSRT